MSIAHIFGNWLSGIPKKLKSQLLVGVISLCWSMWLCRNEVIFDEKISTNPLKIIFFEWALADGLGNLQKPAQKETMLAGRDRLEVVAKQILSIHGWRFSHRICND